MLPSLLIVHNRYATRGGEERIVDQQIEQLKKKGHRVDVYFEDSLDFQRRSPVVQALQALQMPFSFEHYRGLRKKIREVKPGLIHVHNVFPLLSPSVYFAAAAEGVPVVQSVHNYRFMCSNGLFLLPEGTRCERCVGGRHWNAVRFGCYSGSRARSLGMALTLSIHGGLGTFKKKIGAFVAPSLFLQQKLIAGGFPPEKIQRVIPGMSPLSERRHEQEPNTLLYVGRLSREKGLKTLVLAAAELPDWNFQLVGDGVLKEELEVIISEKALRNVRLLGRLGMESIEPLLQKATFLILPSECYENLPTVIMEAWFYGLPVIVSKLGGMAELVEEGKTGFQFPAGDVPSLVKLIRSLSYEQSRSMRDSIKAHFNATYSLDGNYARLMDVYNRALARKLL